MENEKRIGTPIIPITKFPFHRRGPNEIQDWYRGLEKAKEFLGSFKKSGDKAYILILSDVKADGFPHEGEYYYNTLIDKDVSPDDIVFIQKGQETIGQLQWIKDHYKNERVLIISVSIHAFRVRFICKRLSINASHCTVPGAKRKKEMLTDIVLNVVFPFIEWFGLTPWFQKKVTRRRKMGNH